MRVEPCKRVFRLRLWSHFRSRLIGPFLSPPWLLKRKGSFSGPFSGPNLGAPLQALPFFRWCNAAVASAPAEAPVLCVNMDETSLNLMPDALKGAIAPSGRLASRCATLSARRTNATYMASVCSDSALQPYLPQVLLLNQRLLGKEGPGHLGGNLFVWAQKSAWVNASTMRRWLSLLRKALQPRMGARTALVFVDAAPPHLHASVWAHAKRCSVRLLLIPRGLTRLLQPADVALFARFKAMLRRLYAEKLSSSERATLQPLEWLHVVADAIAAVLSSVRWTKIFEKVGILGQQSGMASEICSELGFDSVPVLGPTLPTFAEVRQVFPKHCSLDVWSCVSWSRPRRNAEGRLIRTLD